MDIEKLLRDLARLDPYKVVILREQLERYNDRKTLALIGRFILVALFLIAQITKG